MKLFSILAVGAVLAVATPALSAPINAPGTFTPSAPIVDFESYPVGTPGPITAGIMTVNAPGQVVGNLTYPQYPGIFTDQYFGFSAVTFTIDFSVDVTDVGFGLFDPNFLGTKVEAFDRGGTLLEAIAPPPVGPTGGVFSTYVGFSRALGDIAKIVVTPQAGDLLALDNIAWRTAAPVVPLPAFAWLLLAGLGGLGALRRRAARR